jgi:NitT/TauT family transport system substrate-binding protein
VHVSRMKKRLCALVALAVATAATVVVGTANAGPRSKTIAAPTHLTIAYQPGIGYAPLIMIRQQKLIEKKFPGTTVDWKILASNAPIQDGLISGQIDLGAVGVPTLLLGWAKGINWKYLAPLSEADLWLMVKDPSITKLSDLVGKKIAMPSPTSIQAIVLRKAASVQLGSAKALDSSIVSLEHPDGVQALLTGQVAAHLTSPPFEFQERNQGARILLHSSQYFGAHTFVGLIGQQKFYDQYPDFSGWLYSTIKQQDDVLNTNPKLAGQLLSADSEGTPSAAQFTKWLTAKAVKYQTKPRGLMRFANFMSHNGLLSKMPPSVNDLVFPPVYPTKGS